MFKRIIVLLQVVCILMSFVACNNDPQVEYSTYESIVEVTSNDADQSTESKDTVSENKVVSQTTVQNTSSEVKQDAPTKKAESVANLDFGGKTIKLAITNDKTPTASTKKMFAAFEKKYNCKLKYDVIPFGDFLKIISAKLAGGEPYDIVYLHGSFFPTAAINRILLPLDDAIVDKDKYDYSNPKKGGIDMNKSDYYIWKNEHYGVAGQNDINVPLCYYNKQKFEDAGLEDPYKLYEKGKWTWDKFVEMGKKVTNPAKNVYFTDLSISGSIVHTFGGSYVKFKSSTDVKENTSDPKVFNGLKFLQSISVGNNKIMNTSSGSSSDPTNFLAGNTYVFVGEEVRYADSITPGILDKGKLGGNVKNVGICPLPLGGGNKRYPCNFVIGVGAMRGSEDIRYAVAFAYFRANWKNTASDKYELPSDAQKLVNSFTSTKNLHINYYGYDSNDGTGNSSIPMRTHYINMAVVNGDDITKTLNKYKGSIQNAIDVTLKKQ